MSFERLSPEHLECYSFDDPPITTVLIDRVPGPVSVLGRPNLNKVSNFNTALPPLVNPSQLPTIVAKDKYSVTEPLETHKDSNITAPLLISPPEARKADSLMIHSSIPKTVWLKVSIEDPGLTVEEALVSKPTSKTPKIEGLAIIRIPCESQRRRLSDLAQVSDRQPSQTICHENGAMARPKTKGCNAADVKAARTSSFTFVCL